MNHKINETKKKKETSIKLFLFTIALKREKKDKRNNGLHLQFPNCKNKTKTGIKRKRNSSLFLFGKNHLTKSTLKNEVLYKMIFKEKI